MEHVTNRYVIFFFFFSPKVKFTDDNNFAAIFDNVDIFGIDFRF